MFRPGNLGHLGRLGLVAASRPGLVAQALAILAKYGSAANLYLPGVGAINGITAGNWLDSAGTTAATVDGQVGRVDNARGGAHLTQSTAANRPVLRRGLVNLLTYSHDFGNAVWPSVFTRTLSAGIGPGGSDAWTITGTTTASVFLRPITATGTVISLAVIEKPGTFNSSGGFLIRNHTTATNLTSATTTINLGGGWTLRVLTADTGIALGNEIRLYFGAATVVPNGQYWYLQSAAAFNGALTAQKIIDAGGIPVTTTAPASSANGPFAWQFDGSNDSFASTLTPGNAGFVCVGANFYDNNLRTVLGAGAGTTTGEPGFWVARSGANLQLYVSDGAARQSVSTAYPGATNAVASAGWSADSMMVGANNTEATAAKTLNCATAARQIAIGAYSAGGSTAAMLGTISGGAIIMPTVLPTASERATLRQFIASLSGVTL